MTKIQMKNAIAELDGDEMTRVLWKVIKDELLLPFVDLKTEYFDLGLKSRDDSDDKITYDKTVAYQEIVLFEYKTKMIIMNTIFLLLCS